MDKISFEIFNNFCNIFINSENLKSYKAKIFLPPPLLDVYEPRRSSDKDNEEKFSVQWIIMRDATRGWFRAEIRKTRLRQNPLKCMQPRKINRVIIIIYYQLIIVCACAIKLVFTPFIRSDERKSFYAVIGFSSFSRSSDVIQSLVAFYY